MESYRKHRVIGVDPMKEVS